MYLFIHTTFYFTFFCENKKVISGFYFNCYQLLINKKKCYSIWNLRKTYLYRW